MRRLSRRRFLVQGNAQGNRAPGKLSGERGFLSLHERDATQRAAPGRDRRSRPLVEQNPVHPGEPTLTGLVATLINEVSELKERIEVLERDRPAGD